MTYIIIGWTTCLRILLKNIATYIVAACLPSRITAVYILYIYIPRLKDKEGTNKMTIQNQFERSHLILVELTSFGIHSVTT